MTIHASMAAGLQADFIKTFVAIKIDLPNDTIRLIDGSGVVTFAHGTFYGSDPVGGTIVGLSPIEESLTNEAPRFQITLAPPNTDAMIKLATPRAQGSPVGVFFGLVNDQTGQVIGEPFRRAGFLDFATIHADENQRVVEIECATEADRLFSATDGSRFNDSSHQSVWPGEDLFKYVAVAGDVPIWGVETVGKKK
jgi:hypothetical protein